MSSETRKSRFENDASDYIMRGLSHRHETRRGARRHDFYATSAHDTVDKGGALNLQQLDEPVFRAQSILFCGSTSRVSVLRAESVRSAKERSYNVAGGESHISTHAIAATDKPLDESTARGSKFPAGATHRPQPHITRLGHARGLASRVHAPFFVSYAEHSRVSGGVKPELRLEHARTR